jgi:hypothetical protein
MDKRESREPTDVPMDVLEDAKRGDAHDVGGTFMAQR